ncbi:MAG: hypothetical protein E7642_03070 [Ruminococcaceae bacterium]|nr:hypothetical protein [Oscillospiraceae bacterium]
MSKNITISKSGKKSLTFLALFALVGALMLLASKCSASDGKKVSSPDSMENLDPSKYAVEIEKKVEELCNKIDGVSSTHAVVTLRGGYRAIYAADRQSGSSNSKDQIVVIGSGSSEKPLLIGYENPEIAGIGIVCSGGDDARKREEVISVVSSAFDIPTNKIFVVGS